MWKRIKGLIVEHLSVAPIRDMLRHVECQISEAESNNVITKLTILEMGRKLDLKCARLDEAHKKQKEISEILAKALLDCASHCAGSDRFQHITQAKLIIDSYVDKYRDEGDPRYTTTKNGG